MAERTGTATETAREGADGDTGDEGSSRPAWELDPMGDGFIRRFVGALVHLRRYAKFYSVGAAWLLLMALVQPFGSGSEPPFGFASVGAEAAPSPASGGAFGADPSTAAEGLGDLGPSEEFAYTPYESFASSPEVTRSDEPATPTVPRASSATSTFPTVSTTPPAPVPLRITESGYAAASAGTPADSTPEGGLPVAVTAGTESKLSFIGLTGTDTVLRLRLADAPQTLPEAARVQACPITGDWSPERGASLTESPTYDCERGVVADVEDDIFVFDLSGVPGGPGGSAFALVSYTVSDPAITFEVVFADQAVTDAA